MALVNNVTRLLDSHKIAYTTFELPGEKLSALQVASLLNVPSELVYKTIVIKREAPKKAILVLVPAAAIADLKLVAAALGEKKVHLPTEREAEQLTGLLAGGISPLALIHKGFKVLIDSSAMSHIEIHLSGGERRLNIRLAVEDLGHLTGAQFAPVIAAATDG